MPANSSDNTANVLKAFKAQADAELRWSGRFLMLALNFIPMIQAALLVIVLVPPYAGLAVRVAVFAASLYLVPPILARVVLFFVPVLEGKIAVGTRPFFGWWATFQLQIMFCRFPALEELLRLVPGLYSQWLRLWGARIGRLTYWSPGTLITDRSYLSIGDDVVFGAGVRLNAHVLAKAKDGGMELFLATVKVGDRAVVGGYSLLTAGTEISADETTRAFLVSPPFSVWKDGKRVRKQQTPEIEQPHCENLAGDF